MLFDNRTILGGHNVGHAFEEQAIGFFNFRTTFYNQLLKLEIIPSSICSFLDLMIGYQKDEGRLLSIWDLESFSFCL